MGIEYLGLQHQWSACHSGRSTGRIFDEIVEFTVDGKTKKSKDH